MNWKVSILCPTYNHGDYIDRCIQSVLNQTYQDWEMLILDDGSTDETVEKIRKYQDPRIKLHVQENVGIWRLAENYNYLLSKSTGQYIAILEGDDYWPPDKLELQLPLFDQEGIILTCGKANVVDQDDKFIRTAPVNIQKFLSMSREQLTGKLIKQNFIVACTVVVKKDAITSIGGFQQIEGVPYVDYSTWLYLSLCDNFIVSDKILGHHRRHPGQVTDIHMIQLAETTKRMLEKFYTSLNSAEIACLGIKRKQLERIANEGVAKAHRGQAHIKLKKKEWVAAKNAARKGFTSGTLLIKIQCVGIIVFSMIHISV